MPARTGEAYIKGLQEHPREVWIDGERVQDVTTHPALRNGVRSVAALYDMQHDPALREAMTYTSPTTGQPVGLSFLMPQSVADLERRRTMMAHWAWASCGMMGRSPDFLNVLFTAWAGAADYFAQNRPAFKHNVIKYYEFLREQDVAWAKAQLASSLELDFALARSKRDDELPPGSGMPIEVVVLVGAAELQIADANRVRKLGATALRLERNLVLLDVGLAVGSGIEPRHFDRCPPLGQERLAAEPPGAADKRQRGDPAERGDDDHQLLHAADATAPG